MLKSLCSTSDIARWCAQRGTKTPPRASHREIENGQSEYSWRTHQEKVYKKYDIAKVETLN